MSANTSGASSISRRMLSEDADMEEDDRAQAICDYVHKKVLPGLDNDTISPPIELIVYTMRAMVKPTPLIPKIPQLLNYLGHIEYVRCVFMRQLRKIRRLDQQIRMDKDKAGGHASTNEPVEVVPLTKDEREYIEGVLDSDEEMRSTYRKAVTEFSLLYAWDTWCSPKHADLDTVLKTYFPLKDLWGEDASDVEDQYLFHQGLNEGERRALLQSASILLALFQTYRKEKKKKLAPKFSSAAFRTRYALELDIDELVDSTVWYGHEVEEAIQCVESILSFEKK